ncbi:hypothetical protein O3M35_006877 [Rhynocoris fuscipes]|uniref:C2H2-type domain-containing protein n=1 Tax=Rhynocoris fuscipes TaxID=488301 RepID=A0AAW1DHS2_9HEMI
MRDFLLYKHPLILLTMEEITGNKLLKEKNVLEPILFVAVNGGIKLEQEDVSSPDCYHNEDKVDSDIEEEKYALSEQFHKQSANIVMSEKKNDVAKPFKCDECHRCFTASKRLKYHMRTHYRKKLYKCTECGYSSIEKTYVVRHMRIHTKERPFKCTECDYCCLHKTSLMSHMRRHKGDKPYKCTQCSYSFNSETNLVTHIRRHTGKNPYKCTECDYSTTQRRHLAQHMRKHTGERPFKCTECNSSFTQKSSVMRHMKKIHTSGKRFLCKKYDNQNNMEVIPISKPTEEEDVHEEILFVPVNGGIQLESEDDSTQDKVDSDTEEEKYSLSEQFHNQSTIIEMSGSNDSLVKQRISEITNMRTHTKLSPANDYIKSVSEDGSPHDKVDSDIEEEKYSLSEQFRNQNANIVMPGNENCVVKEEQYDYNEANITFMRTNTHLVAINI